MGKNKEFLEEIEHDFKLILDRLESQDELIAELNMQVDFLVEKWHESQFEMQDLSYQIYLMK